MGFDGSIITIIIVRRKRSKRKRNHSKKNRKRIRTRNDLVFFLRLLFMENGYGIERIRKKRDFNISSNVNTWVTQKRQKKNYGQFENVTVVL